MIGVSSSGRTFQGLAKYLQTGRTGQEYDRVAWAAARNLPTDDPELAAKIMRATAVQNARVEQPVYHIALSFDPGDSVNRTTMERVADRVLSALELNEHQALIVSHRDRAHRHVHVLVNRVHPDTGKVWNRWQDRRVIQQVLWEEERALGLRTVEGRIGPLHEPRSADRAPPKGVIGRQSPNGEPSLDRTTEPGVVPARSARTHELARELGTHERVVELTREQYHAQIDASAARTRLSQLDAAADRARAAVEAFDRALADVYRNPERAHGAFLAMVGEKGVAATTQAMRERPEQFGALSTVKRARAFGIVRGEDDSQARAKSPAAATKGCNAVEALREFGKVTAEMQARRLEDAFTRELRAIYHEPAAARTSFERCAIERGIEGAAIALREGPEQFGEIRPSIREDRGRIETYAARAAELGFDAAKARAFAQTADAKARDALVKTEPAASRDDVERAVGRESAVRRELGTLPGRSELEHRIANLIDRMSPREVQQLRRVVSAPRFALAMELRTTIRDVALGRDDERNR